MDVADSKATTASGEISPISEIISATGQSSDASTKKDIKEEQEEEHEASIPVLARSESPVLMPTKAKLSPTQRMAVALGLKMRPKPSQVASRQFLNQKKAEARRKEADIKRNKLTAEVAGAAAAAKDGSGKPPIQNKPTLLGRPSQRPSPTSSVASVTARQEEIAEAKSMSLDAVPIVTTVSTRTTTDQTVTDPQKPKDSVEPSGESISVSSSSTKLAAHPAARKNIPKQPTCAAHVVDTVNKGKEDTGVGISNRWRKQSQLLSQTHSETSPDGSKNRAAVRQQDVTTKNQSAVPPSKNATPRRFGFFRRLFGTKKPNPPERNDTATVKGDNSGDAAGGDDDDDDEASGRFSAPYSPSVTRLVDSNKEDPIIAMNMAQSTSYFILPTPVGGSPWFNVVVSAAIFWPVCHFFTEQVAERQLPQSWPSEDETYDEHEYSELFLQKAETARDEMWRMVFVLAGLFVLYARWTCFDLGFFLIKRRNLLRQYLQMGTEATVARLRSEDAVCCSGCDGASCLCCEACSTGGGGVCSTIFRTVRSHFCFLCGLRPEEKGVVTYKYESAPYGAFVSIASTQDESTVRPTTRDMTDSQRRSYFGLNTPTKKEEAGSNGADDEAYKIDTSMISASTESSVRPSTKDMTDSQRRRYFGLEQTSTHEQDDKEKAQKEETPDRKEISIDDYDFGDDETSGADSSTRPTTTGMTESQRRRYFGVDGQTNQGKDGNGDRTEGRDEGTTTGAVSTTHCSPASPPSLARTTEANYADLIRQKSFLNMKGSDWFIVRRTLGTLVPVPPRGEEISVRVQLLSPNEPLSGRVRDDLEVEWAVTSSDRFGFQVNMFLGISWMLVTGMGIGYTISRIVSFVPSDQLIIPCMILGMMLGPLMVILFTIQLAFWMYHKERFTSGGEVVATSSDRRGRPRMIHTSDTPLRPTSPFDTLSGRSSPWGGSHAPFVLSSDGSASETAGSAVTSQGYSAPGTPLYQTSPPGDRDDASSSSSGFFSETKTKGRNVASKALRALRHRQLQSGKDDPMQSRSESKTTRLLDDVVANELHEYYHRPSMTDDDDDEEDLEFGHSYIQGPTARDIQRIFDDPQDDEILQCMPSALFRECDGGIYGNDGHATVMSTPMRKAAFMDPFASPSRFPSTGNRSKGTPTDSIHSPPPRVRTFLQKKETELATMKARTQDEANHTNDPMVSRRSPVPVSLPDPRDLSATQDDAPETIEVVNATGAPSTEDSDVHTQPPSTTASTYVYDPTAPKVDSTREIADEGTTSSTTEMSAPYPSLAEV